MGNKELSFFTCIHTSKDIPAQFGKHFGDPNYDWNLRTEPQKHADNQSYHWARGKTLGGSSAINFYVRYAFALSANCSNQNALYT